MQKKIEIPEKCEECPRLKQIYSERLLCDLYQRSFSQYLLLGKGKPNFCRAISVTIEEKEDES